MGSASTAIDGFTEEGLPFAREGFGVRRNFYQSGRISAKVGDIAGLFELNYVGAQPFQQQRFFSSAAENCVWMRQFTPSVLIDGKPYRLPFTDTVHYPFGYRSECVLDGVRLRHEFVLDRNAAFRRMTVLSNPQGRSVKARVTFMSAGLPDGLRWRVDAAKNALVADWRKGSSHVTMEAGAACPLVLPLNDRPPQPLAWPKNGGVPDFRFDLVTVEPAETFLFWWVFDRAPDEALCTARVDRVFSAFAAHHAHDARFETGDELADGWLGFVAPMSAAHEVDGCGAFRASPTYWVWGWDALVHAGALALCGRAAEVRRMLCFHRDAADPQQGILHAYQTDFRFAGCGTAAPGGALTLPPAVQLYWVILLNEYVAATGDEAFKAECLPFARTLVERAKASAGASGGLPRGIGYFPDNPYAVGQTPGDFALINASVYWQGLCAWTALSGEGAAEAEAVGRTLVRTFWDSAEGWWSDSWDAAARARRAHYPLYGLFHVSSFARGLLPDDAAACAAYAKKAFFLGDRLAMFGWGTPAFCADGNQLGSYYPVADRTYWNLQNAAGRLDALDDFRHIVARHARVLTYPEGQTADVVNADPEDGSDELGNKQFFAAKGWLADALDLWLGLRVETGGLRFRPMNDGRPFAVRGLSVRGTTLDVVLEGRGTCAASCTLDGAALPDAFVPWTALRPGGGTLHIRLTMDARADAGGAPDEI